MQRFRNLLIKTEILFLLVLVMRPAEERMQQYADTATAACFAEYKENEQTDTEELTDKERGQTMSSMKIALTFDDGPNEDYTEELLQGLEARDVKATFFLIGKKVDENPELVKKIYEGGHLIGNHTFDHANLCELSAKEAAEQIRHTNEVIEEVTGELPEYLRPPFGCNRKDLDESMNMIEVLWDVDPRDWSDKNTGLIVDRVVKKVKENDIILLHDEYATSIAAAFEIIDILKSKGYEFVTVDELIFE